MRQKEILIISIIAIIAILLCLTTFFIVNSHEESLSTLRISNSCTIDVPAENSTMERVNGISKYIYKSGDLNISHQKTENNSEIKKMNTNQMKNSQKVEDNIYFDSSSGIYSTFIENQATGDAILITAKDLDLLKNIAKSVKFTNPKNIEVADDNATEEVDDSYVEESSYDNEEYYNYQNYETYSNYPSQSSSSNAAPSEPAQSEPENNEPIIK